MNENDDIKRCTKCNRSFCEVEGVEPSEICGTCIKMQKKHEVQ